MEKFSDILQYFKELSARKVAGFEADMEDEFEEKFGDDSETKFKIGQDVKKATYEIGDIHQINHKGKVVGAMRLTLDESDVYLVQFEGDIHCCLTLAYKLKSIN